MYHFANGCVRARVFVCFRIAYTLNVLWRKSYCAIVSNIHDTSASFLYFILSHFFQRWKFRVIIFAWCYCFSDRNSMYLFFRSFVVSLEYLTVFFRFVILFAWAVIIDAAQFTSHIYCYVRCTVWCTFYTYMALTRKSHKISRLLRWQRISNATFEWNERKKAQLPNGTKNRFIFSFINIFE